MPGLSENRLFEQEGHPPILSLLNKHHLTNKEKKYQLGVDQLETNQLFNPAPEIYQENAWEMLGCLCSGRGRNGLPIQGDPFKPSLQALFTPATPHIA